MEKIQELNVEISAQADELDAMIDALGERQEFSCVGQVCGVDGQVV